MSKHKNAAEIISAAVQHLRHCAEQAQMRVSLNDGGKRCEVTVHRGADRIGSVVMIRAKKGRCKLRSDLFGRVTDCSPKSVESARGVIAALFDSSPPAPSGNHPQWVTLFTARVALYLRKLTDRKVEANNGVVFIYSPGGGIALATLRLYNANEVTAYLSYKSRSLNFQQQTSPPAQVWHRLESAAACRSSYALFDAQGDLSQHVKSILDEMLALATSAEPIKTGRAPAPKAKGAYKNSPAPRAASSAPGPVLRTVVADDD